jgi:hypothetical protein
MLGFWSKIDTYRWQQLFFTMILTGIGGFISPFVCQAVMASGIPWTRFYLGSLVVSATNLIFITFSFRSTQAEFDADKRASLFAAKRRSSTFSDEQKELDSTSSNVLSPVLADAPLPAHSQFQD